MCGLVVVKYATASWIMMPQSSVPVSTKISVSSRGIDRERWIGRTTRKYVANAVATPASSPHSAPASEPTISAMIQATTAADTRMVPPCARFSTPDTPNISVKPTAPRP